MKYLRFCCLLGVALVSTLSVCHAASAINDIYGTWDVIHAGVDRRDQPHWAYYPDDPRLLGRVFNADSAQLHLNDGSNDCTKPQWKKSTVTWKQLIGKSFPRPLQFDTPQYPLPKDFDLKLNPAETVTAFHVSCAPREQGSTLWANSWIVLDKGKLYASYSGSTVLTFEKRAATAQPRASFSCRKAQTPTEKTICANISLAALDRSVAAAWRGASREGSDNAELRKEQHQWLQARDKCGTDVQCLSDKMMDRINDLMQDW